MKEINVDLAVVAAGPAGLAAAISGAEGGLSVAVFEKTNVTGGSANMGMGPFAVGSKIQKRNLIGLTRDEAFKKFMDYTHWRVDANLVRKYIDKSSDTIEWLEDMGVEFFDSARFFADSEATWHRVKPDNGIPGPRGASKMFSLMTERARELGVEFYLETPAKEILVEDGVVKGVVVVNASGEEIKVNSKAVVVATGGFGANPKMVKEELGRNLGQDLFLFPIPGLQGDGCRMAWAAGAAKSEIVWEMAYCMPASIDADPEISRVFCQPNLLVNLEGERFINEAIMDNTTFTGNAINLQTNHVAYSIVDSSIIKRYEKNGMDCVSLVYPFFDLSNFNEKFMAAKEAGNPDLYYGETLEELAEATGIDVQGLLDTVDEYNDMCDSVDSKFNKPNDYMRPLKKGPYYAGRMFPSGYGTLGGIKINHRMEVVSTEGKTIKGFYAAGTDACNIFGDSYVFIMPGNTMGFCINGGRMAGENAADYISDLEG